MSNDPRAELDNLSDALIAARLDIAQWRAQAKTWEDNAGQAVALANREQRKRQEAYAKLDILMREYRQLALALAGQALSADHDLVKAVTDAFLERLSLETGKLETGKLEPGGSGEGSDAEGPHAEGPHAEGADRADAVDPGLADRGAGGAHRG
jgi:hypothetical protein